MHRALLLQTDLYKRALKTIKQKNTNYMSMPEELAARCFEACIASHPHIKNSFLVSGLKSSDLIYPDDEHINAANKALNQYFELLGYALHKLDE